MCLTLASCIAFSNKLKEKKLESVRTDSLLNLSSTSNLGKIKAGWGKPKLNHFLKKAIHVGQKRSFTVVERDLRVRGRFCSTGHELRRDLSDLSGEGPDSV